MVVTRRGALLMAGAAAAAPSAFAHRAQTVLSTVEWNAGNKSIDVIHRLHAHDSGLALAAKGASLSADDMDMAIVVNQARLALYVEERFKLADDAGAIPLNIVGAELEGDQILVFQDATRPEPPRELSVTNGILRDVFEEQTNLVNVRMGARTRTLIFSGRDDAKTARDLL